MNQKERSFVEVVKHFYRISGRHDLPWRHTADPYHILVSELMLQQTQVARVIPKYEEFVARWPNAQHLANAQLGDVLRAWQGLGYNRRAKFLHEAVRVVTNELAGQFPQNELELQKLPGLGPYTAAAICAFAYNQPVALIETNVRQVFLHHFYKNKEQITDTEILTLVKKTLPSKNIRKWYWALMDYGSYLKQQHGNLGRKSKHYTKQSKFKGSDREVRGAIVRTLGSGAKSLAQIKTDLVPLLPEQITMQLPKLLSEGLIVKEGSSRYRLP